MSPDEIKEGETPIEENQNTPEGVEAPSEGAGPTPEAPVENGGGSEAGETNA